MRNLVYAEFLKLRTTRSFAYSALAAMAFVPITLAISILTAGNDGAGPALDTSEGVRQVFSAASSGTIIVLIIGIIVMAGERVESAASGGAGRGRPEPLRPGGKRLNSRMGNAAARAGAGPACRRAAA